jgi:hypothetical protein
MALRQHIKKRLKHVITLVFAIAAFGAAQVAAQFSQELPPVQVTLNVGDTILTVEGRTAPGAFVTIMENSNPIGTTTANSSGNFSRSFTAQTPGLHNISVFASKDGQTTDTVTQNVNLVAQAETTMTFFLPSTLVLSSNSVTQGDDIKFSGATIPGGTVTINIDNNLIRTVTANSSGNWSYTLSTDGISPGTHHVFVVVNDGSGNYSAPTTKRAFQVVAPEQEEPPEAVPPPSFIQPPTITKPRNNQRFTTSPIEVSGIALGNSQIEIWEGDNIIGSVFANHLGEWLFMMDLTNPQHEIRARACILDVCSDFSDTVRIYFDGEDGRGGEGISPFYLRLEKYRYPNEFIGQPIVLGLIYGGGEIPYELVVDWGDDTVEQLTVDGGGTMDMKHAYDSAGQFTGVVTMRDSANAVKTAYFSVLVTEAPRSIATVVLIIAVVVSGTIVTLITAKLGWLKFLRLPRQNP